jgi:hypothetical protein
MPCTIQVNNVFGPAVSSTCHYGFDFTLLFEEVFLCIVPIVVLTLLIPIRLYQLLPRKLVFRPVNFYYTKLVRPLLFPLTPISLTNQGAPCMLHHYTTDQINLPCRTWICPEDEGFHRRDGFDILYLHLPGRLITF